MSWAIGYDSHWSRDVGYGVPAWCDYPECNKEIDRGLSFVCGEEQFGGDEGCGLYFCENHLMGRLCERCSDNNPDSFTPKPDHPDWMKHKLTDDSWRKWRDENPEEVSLMLNT